MRCRTGAVFQILTTSGDVVTEWTTDGSVKTFHALLDVETDYVLHEKTVPTGYRRLHDLPFSLNANGTVQIGEGAVDYLEMEGDVLNVIEEKVKLKVKKINANGNPVPGAEFTLKGTGTSSYITTWTSDEFTHTITDILPGVYDLTETPPVGYVQINPVTISIDEYGEVTITKSLNEENVLVDENEVNLLIVKNNPIPENVLIGKTVRGAFGNRKREFQFELNLEKAEDDAILPNTVMGTRTFKDGQMETVEYTVDDDGVIEFALRDGETVLFENIPYGTRYHVNELIEESDGYTVRSTNEEGVLTGYTDVEFINTKDTIIPTSANTQVIILIAMLALAVLLISGMVFRKRRTG